MILPRRLNRVGSYSCQKPNLRPAFQTHRQSICILCVSLLNPVVGDIWLYCLQRAAFLFTCVFRGNPLPMHLVLVCLCTHRPEQQLALRAQERSGYVERVSFMTHLSCHSTSFVCLSGRICSRRYLCVNSFHNVALN